MFSAQTNTTVIGRLRIRSKSPDPQAEQQSISRMLRSATLHPAGLPESAMLVVRRLADPLPSRLRVGLLDSMPDSLWQRAVAGSLEKLAASAARPAYGAVPAESGAVLFYDRAEVLAALALDWMSGTLSLQWWWRELLRGRDAVTALFCEWVEAPQYIPGALELLAKRARAVQFVQRLPEPAAVGMLDAVLRVHGVPCMNLDDLKEQPDVAALKAAKTKTHHRESTLRAPWLRWAPEASTPGLSVVQKRLLIQGLMLRRAPATARTVAFQKELVANGGRSEELARKLQWQARTKSENANLSEDETQQNPLNELSPLQQPAPAISEQVAGERERDGGSTLANPPLMHDAIPGRQAAETVATRRLAPKGNDDLSKPAPLRALSGQVGGVRKAGEPVDSAERFQPQSAGAQEITLPDAAGEQSSPREVTQLEQAPPTSTILETEYGGVFFLMGLALHLGIYSDFTSPVETGLELNIWDFLALMAAEFTGGKIESDPLWTALAELAGRRKSEKPGLAFDPPNEWRLPRIEEWLEPFSADYDQTPVLIDGRMVSMHPAGFTVLDVPASEVHPSEPVDRLQRWVGWMARYLYARLRRALGREDAAAFVCRSRAQVSLTLTHLDVTFSLDYHPIEVRIAGLDRDLGWIPAAGRYVAFHFE